MEFNKFSFHYKNLNKIKKHCNVISMALGLGALGVGIINLLRRNKYVNSGHLKFNKCENKQKQAIEHYNSLQCSQDSQYKLLKQNNCLLNEIKDFITFKFYFHKCFRRCLFIMYIFCMLLIMGVSLYFIYLVITKSGQSFSYVLEGSTALEVFGGIILFSILSISIITYVFVFDSSKRIINGFRKFHGKNCSK